MKVEEAWEMRPDWKMLRAVHVFADERRLADVWRQVPFTAKHQAARLMPPVPYKEEVAVVKFAMLLRDNSEPGEEVPMPTLPALVMRSASESVPEFRVEKRRSPLPPLKFCWRMEEMSAVVVAAERSFWRKAMRALVVVAEARLPT